MNFTLMKNRESIGIFTSMSIPFSSASFRARGDATTRPSWLVVVFSSFLGVCCSVLLVESSFFGGSFSFFSVLSVGALFSSEDFFAGDVWLPSSLKSLNAAISSLFSTTIAHN
jgi:hypothetical protein